MSMNPKGPDRYAIFLAAIVLAAAVPRIVLIAEKRQMSHDEPHAYLAATAHQGQYERTAGGDHPYGAWVKAAEWKRFLRVDEHFCFARIASDLARYDRHPPLYFWLLHVWVLVTGVTLWAGPALNTFIATVSAVCLFTFARRILARSADAALVAITWALSPAVLIVSFEARPYDLLALITVLFVWQIIRCVDASACPKRRSWILLIILAAAGALTHYHFVLVTVAGVVFGIAACRHDRRRALCVLGSIAAGYLIFVAVHPSFHLSFVGGEGAIHIGHGGDVAAKINNSVDAFLHFLGLTRLRWPVVMVLPILAGYLVVRRFDDVRVAVRTGTPVLFFFVWIAGSTTVLYLASLSPKHAMGDKYLAAAWPFLAFAPVLVLRCFGRATPYLAGAFCAGLVLIAVAAVTRLANTCRRASDPAALFVAGDRIVVDTPYAGVFPRIFAHVPDDTVIFCARQDDLLAHPARWLPDRSRRCLYITHGGRSDHQTRRPEVLSLIRRTHRTRNIPGGIRGVGTVFAVEPIAAPPRAAPP